MATVASGGALSHRSAAFIHGLDGIKPSRVEVLIPNNRAMSKGPWTTHRSGLIVPGDTTRVLALPVTGLARTICDLGAVIGDDLLEQALDDAFRRGLTRPHLLRTLERLDSRGRPGCAALKRVLARPDRRGPLPDSMFERILERACVSGGLPQPQRQIPIHDARGRVIHRLDAGWAEAMLAVEGDSMRWHSGVVRIRSDNRRDLALMRVGWEVCYLGWGDAQQPERFIDALVETYHRRVALHRGARPADRITT